ncbi:MULTISPECIES: hypothetical protein [unclassified Rhodococcus (in: high G+C Gram-positive bacteria)]|uniref:hypothetical protein n=1 Tax=unclassified Rhodococcus (in: high G+C Gram-positive bacteria) TaxID=192944 RepID=UPI000E0BA866|nr:MULTISPECIES: hypothetical protein [unclassified Rhodococcus (in: high G+C Gram-positive bacteria)]QKT10058.1 hypothetical protein HUN07_04420 [Rhodococcus sp. W8901]RDI17569.1 hypothetical protein DEU38_12212 [Rhodococcus sp. AG1013]
MGKHRKSRARTIARVALVPSAAAAVVVAASGAASAAPDQLPSQGGVTSAPQTQGGVTSGPSSQGGVTSAPAQPEPVYWVEPPAQYQNIEYQPLDNYDYDTNTYNAPDNYYVAPVQFEDLHLPTYVEPTAPIIAPRETLRLGTFHTPQPNWITDGDLARTNNTSAVIEAEVSTFWRSLGVETTRANRLAAAQLGMGAAGAIGTGVVGALVGGTIGGGIGAGMWGGTDLLIPGGQVVFVTNGVAGTAIGAAVGGVLGAVPGAVTGVIAGTTIGTGDLGEPQELPAEVRSYFNDVDQPAVTAQTQETLAQWETTPIGGATASAVRDVVNAAPGIDRQARDFVAARPGGSQVLDQIDGALTTFVAESSLGVAANMISGAVGGGIQA